MVTHITIMQRLGTREAKPPHLHASLYCGAKVRTRTSQCLTVMTFSQLLKRFTILYGILTGKREVSLPAQSISKISDCYGRIIEIKKIDKFFSVSLGVKRQGRWADHSPISNASFFGMLLNSVYGTTFTFTFNIMLLDEDFKLIFFLNFYAMYNFFLDVSPTCYPF